MGTALHQIAKIDWWGTWIFSLTSAKLTVSDSGGLDVASQYVVARILNQLEKPEKVAFLVHVAQTRCWP